MRKVGAKSRSLTGTLGTAARPAPGDVVRLLGAGFFKQPKVDYFNDTCCNRPTSQAIGIMARPFEFADLITGFSINQLSQLFSLDRRTVSERLRGLAPSGYRANHPVYKIADAAPLLIDGYLYADQVDERTKLQNAGREKDLWDAALKKQKFMEQEGDLWRTDKVVQVLADMFKLFRESVTVFVDALEHESDLPPPIVAKAKAFGDALLAGLRERLLALDTGFDDQPGYRTHEAAELLDDSEDAESEHSSDEELADLGLL